VAAQTWDVTSEAGIM